MTKLVQRIGISLPILQAPMAGVSTPELAAAVSRAGALGAVSVGASEPAAAASMIGSLRELTGRPFNVNVFVHQPPRTDAERERRWLDALTPAFHEFEVEPPSSLHAIYSSFNDDDEMLKVLLAATPAVVSFHFGLPRPEYAEALRRAGAMLIASVTKLTEGRAAEAAGMDAVVAQGWEAGGHRGVFDPAAPDERLGTLPLTRRLVGELKIPVIAAGGIMDGAAIAAALDSGAEAAQLGTAFVACPESSASAAHREALVVGEAARTVMTDAISGRPARCIANRFTALAEELGPLRPPDYPIAYDAGKALHAAASRRGEHGFGAQWAGEGAARARTLPAADLVAVLARELDEARGFS